MNTFLILSIIALFLVGLVLIIFTRRIVIHTEQINTHLSYMANNVNKLTREFPSNPKTPAQASPSLDIDKDLEAPEDKPNIFNYDEASQDEFDEDRLSFRDRAATNEFLQPGQTKVATLKQPRPIGAVIRKTQGNESAYAEIVSLSRLVAGTIGIAYRYKLRVLEIYEYDELVNVSGKKYKKHRGRKLRGIDEQLDAAEHFKAKQNLL